MINIKSFGAVGNGVADDTAALKKALVSEEPIYFPSGIYLVNEQLFADNISLYWYGAGRSSVIRLIPSATAGKATSDRHNKIKKVLDMRLLLLKNCNEIELNDLTFDANKDAFVNDAYSVGSCEDDFTTCLDIHHAKSVTLSGVTCRGGLIEGAYILRANKIDISRCCFVDNGVYGYDASGLHIEGRNVDGDDIHITSCEFSSNGFDGLLLNGVNGADVRDVICRKNGFDGIAFWGGSSRCLISGAVSEHNDRSGVTFRRNHSAGNMDVYLEGCDKFCADNVLEELVTVGNAYGIHWGCSERTTIKGWHSADRFTHSLCFLKPQKDITALLSDVHLSPKDGEIWNTDITCDDKELYDEQGPGPCSDLSRFKLVIE